MTTRIDSRILPSLLVLSLTACESAPTPTADPALRLATLQPGETVRMTNAGWSYDRYADLPTLDAGTSMVVADLEGPGVIRAFHTTRHNPVKTSARGVVLQIWFDDAELPAVQCPLADFFGDGCNGGSIYFSTPLIECAPWSYNSYFPMPFAKRARVVLRNDTEVNLWNYSFVEWERLPEWNEELGYFHTTYARDCFQLSKDSNVTFFEVEGAGQLIGRQYSVVTDEPMFRDFNTVMEGNNSVDIDGVERHLDYLGTEDSFGFSWGFQNTFAGLRAGMPLVEKCDPSRLSIYRFHDHAPIRYDESLRWRIDWTQERSFTGNPEWAAAVEAGGCWVDYATVHYWYQRSPDGYAHQELPSVAERAAQLLHSSLDRGVPAEFLDGLPLDPRLDNDFAAEDDLRRIGVLHAWPDTHPFWIDLPETHGGHPGNPNPGRQGILGVHARNARTPCLVARKVQLPATGNPTLRLSVSGDPYEVPGLSDFVLRVGVHSAGEVHWLGQETIDAGAPPSSAGWRTMQYGLAEFTGREVVLVVEVAYGGSKRGGMNEEAFLDELSVIE